VKRIPEEIHLREPRRNVFGFSACVWIQNRRILLFLLFFCLSQEDAAAT